MEPVLVDRLDQLRLITGAAPAIASLDGAGFLCPVVTVQSRIEKGVFSEHEFRDWFEGFADMLAAEGAFVAGIYLCPHRFSTACACAKPATRLYEQAAADLGIDLSRSFTIGDTAADVEAAKRFGGSGCLVCTGYAAQGPVSERALEHAAVIGANLQEIADWIIGRGNRAHSESAD